MQGSDRVVGPGEHGGEPCATEVATSALSTVAVRRSPVAVSAATRVIGPA